MNVEKDGKDKENKEKEKEKDKDKEREVTQTQTAQSVALRVDFEQRRILGATTLTFSVPEISAIPAVVRLNSRGCGGHIRRITANTVPTSFVLNPSSLLLSSNSISPHAAPEFREKWLAALPAADEGELAITMPSEVISSRQASLTIRIEYEISNPTLGIHFVFPEPGLSATVRVNRAELRFNSGKNAPENAVSIYHARFWTPCIDNPQHKTSWTVEIHSPATFPAPLIPASANLSKRKRVAASRPRQVMAQANGSLVYCGLDLADESWKISRYFFDGSICASGILIVVGVFEYYRFDQIISTVMKETVDNMNSPNEFAIPSNKVPDEENSDDDKDDDKAEKDSSVLQSSNLKNGVLCEVFFPEGFKLEVQATVDFLPHAMEFYEQYTGLSYPFPSLKLIFVHECVNPIFIGAGIVILSSHFLIDEDDIENVYDSRKRFAIILASQWFGQYMTHRNWTDVWLTLGLSKYIAGQFVRKLLGNNEYRYRLDDDMKRCAAMDVGQLPLCPAFLLAEGTSADAADPLLARYFYPDDEEDSLRTEFLSLKAPLIIGMLDQRQGPFVVRVHEPKGTAYSHQIFIDEMEKVVEIPYHTKYKRAGQKLKKLQKMGIMTEENDNEEEEFREEFQAPEKGKPDLDQFDRRSLDWIRWDPDCDWLCLKVHDQLRSMWIEQLNRDNDVVAHHEAIVRLGTLPDNLSTLAIARVLHDPRYFYRLRMDAAFALAKLGHDSTQAYSGGVGRLMNYFTEKYCYPKTSKSMMTIPRPNDFHDIAEYFVKKAVCSSLVTCRDAENKVLQPNKAVILNLLQFNDNSKNEFSDAYYIASLINALCHSTIHQKPRDTQIKPRENNTAMYEGVVEVFDYFDDVEEEEEMDYRTPAEKEFFTNAHSETLRYLALDRLAASHQNVVTRVCLNAILKWMLAGFLPVDLRFFMNYAGFGNFFSVRLAAIDALLLLDGLYTDEIFDYLLKLIESDPDKYFSYHVAKELCNFALLIKNLHSQDLKSKKLRSAKYTWSAIKSKIDKNPEWAKSIWGMLKSDQLDFRTKSHLLRFAEVVYKTVQSSNSSGKKIVIKMPTLLIPEIADGVVPAKSRQKTSQARAKPAPKQPTFMEQYPPIEAKFAEAANWVLTNLQNQPAAAAFLLPVDESFAPLYFSLIKNPMDLSAIAKKLNSGAYKNNLQLLFSDVYLIFSNCYKYNTDDSQVAVQARKLEFFFTNILKPRALEHNLGPINTAYEDAEDLMTVVEITKNHTVESAVPQESDKGPTLKLTISRQSAQPVEKVAFELFDPGMLKIPTGQTTVIESSSVLKLPVVASAKNSFSAPLKIREATSEASNIIALTATLPLSSNSVKPLPISTANSTDPSKSRSIPPTTSLNQNKLLSIPIDNASSITVKSGIPSDKPPPRLVLKSSSLKVSVKSAESSPAKPVAGHSVKPVPESRPVTQPLKQLPQASKQLSSAAVSVTTNTLQKSQNQIPLPKSVLKLKKESLSPPPSGIPKRKLSLDSGTVVKSVVKPEAMESEDYKKCKKIHRHLLENDKSFWFREPVDPIALGIPNYFDVIKEPMDLGTLKTKLSKNLILTTKDFRRQTALIFKNAMKFNPENTQVHQDAKILYDILKTEYNHYFGGVDGEGGCNGNQNLLLSHGKATKREDPVTQSPVLTVVVGPSNAVENEPQLKKQKVKHENSILSSFSSSPMVVQKMSVSSVTGKKCLKVLRKLQTNNFGKIFLEPVDPVKLNIPTYFDIIKRPMDLRTIQQKLEASTYEDHLEFKADVELMLQNCATFNMPGDWVSSQGQSLKKVFTTEWNNIDWDNLAVPISARPVGPTINSVLKKLREHNDAVFFLEPVDPAFFPDYHLRIKKPIDLRTMTEKLDGGGYSTLEEFEKDFRLLINNCYTYNPKGSMGYNCGASLEKYFKSIWKK
ncbi:hypothetical protein HK100_001943 [Physocladia obscura]|uniref:Transcription initiation factor TFIID subunit 2 n=1 Tax=Physocladia obscura TaxID=109957 RepID=A0AAD5SY43_9FUNG|nr:hypothetical protein HK100_001943 [Physocladia obscura]